MLEVLLSFSCFDSLTNLLLGFEIELVGNTDLHIKYFVVGAFSFSPDVEFTRDGN